MFRIVFQNVSHLLLFEIYALEMRKMFVYKYTQTMDILKISLIFKKNTNSTSK